MNSFMWRKISNSTPGFLGYYARYGNQVFRSFISGSSQCFTTTSATGSKHSRQEKIAKSPFPHVDIPDITYTQFVFNQMAKFREKSFLVCGETGREYSYYDVQLEVCRVASCLIRRGVVPGTRVAFFSFNKPEYFISLLAVIAVGAIAVDINPNFTPGELHVQLKATDTSYLFVHSSNAQKAMEACATLPKIKEIFVFGNADRCLPYSELAKDEGDLFKGPLSCDTKDTIHMPSSSGTTGLPKGVMRSHQNLVASAYVTNHSDIHLFVPEDTGLLFLPLYHLYANFLMGTVLLTGARVIFQETFNPERTLELLQKYRVTFFPVVPPLVSFLNKHPLVDKYDLSSLKRILCGAAPLSVHEQQDLVKRLNLSFMGQGYGMTEMCPVSLTPKSANDYTACGKIVCNTEVKVINGETGEELDIGSEGEIYAKGPHIMTGYEKNLEATSCTILDGWLKSGDYGSLRSDGSVCIVDRLKDFIKVKAHQVAPAELEALLKTHPAVQDVAVIGVPDDKYGEAPRAYVVLKNKNTSVKDLALFVAERTSSEKHLIGGVVALNEIPKSASGKILKKDLRKL